jgi:hypothetical protein
MRVHEPCSSLRERFHLACFARTAPVLSASRRVAKTARSGVLGVCTGTALSREPNLLCTYTNLAQACESVFTLRVCDTQQLYTDAAIQRRSARISARTAPVLSTSRRVAKTARSGVLGVHGHYVVSNQTCCSACTSRTPLLAVFVTRLEADSTGAVGRCVCVHV